MPMKRNLRSTILAMLSLALILALTSCTTYPTEENKIALPYFPSFPDPISDDGTALVTLNPNTEEVAMPLWYWKAIATYVIDTESAIERLKIDMEVQE